MHRRHAILWLTILPPFALISGCRSDSWAFSPLKSMVDASWESQLERNETPNETEERRWRESREE